MKKPKKFLRLMLWELEENWSLPTPEIIAGIAIYFGLAPPPTPRISPSTDLLFTIGRFFMFEMLIAAVMFARSIAGSIEKREILTYFTYPVTRKSILTSKFLTNLSLIFLIFGSTIIVRALLTLTEPWNTTVLIALFILFIQILFLSTLSLIFSLLTKRTWATILLVIVSLLTLSSFLPQPEPPLKYIIPTSGAEVIFDYLAKGPIHYTPEDFTVALGSPVITSIFLLLIAYTYFKRMQVD